MICAICLEPAAPVTDKKRINGLPVTVPACALCRDAAQRRDLGVTIAADGTLRIYGTDGRGATHPRAQKESAA